jgi:hypothetical protein
MIDALLFTPSFPGKREFSFHPAPHSTSNLRGWIPAFAGMTSLQGPLARIGSHN